MTLNLHCKAGLDSAILNRDLILPRALPQHIGLEVSVPSGAFHCEVGMKAMTLEVLMLNKVLQCLPVVGTKVLKNTFHCGLSEASFGNNVRRHRTGLEASR